MQFNSLQFMVFFPVALAISFVVPRKLRVYWLLACSYFFYMSWNRSYALLMLASTAATYLAGLAMEKIRREHGIFGEASGFDPNARASKRCKAVFISCIVFNLSILGLFKYANMVLSAIGSGRTLDLLLPVGISFYTFQALGYIIDVYRGEVEAERSFAKYALFVSFFPQLVAGPIERSRSLLGQIREADKIELWNAERITKGAILMVWGFFLKMVISDRAAILVDAVWDNYAAFGKGALILASFCFTLQIYCDFGGYSLIAIGAARMLGFSLMENFNTPYLATGIKDFWARWHISLSTWFRDYLYIPLGGSRKGQLRKYVNLMVTFLLSGLWHGADWSFVLWGGLHGAARALEEGLGQLKRKRSAAGKRQRHLRPGSPAAVLLAFLKWLATMLFVNFAWIFFRASSIADGIGFIKALLSSSTPFASDAGFLAGQTIDGPVSIGLDGLELAILFGAVLVLCCFSIIKRRSGEAPEVFLTKQRLSAEWGILIGLILAIFIFGEYGPTFDPKAFIYFQF